MYTSMNILMLTSMPLLPLMKQKILGPLELYMEPNKSKWKKLLQSTGDNAKLLTSEST